MTFSVKRARTRRKCTIDLDWVLNQWNKQGGKCYYTGWNMELDGSLALKPTLERVDSQKDYVEGNVVICCRQVNWAKNNYSLEDFLNMCKSVTKNRSKINVNTI